MVAAYTSRFGSGRLGEGRFGGSGRPFVPDVTGPWASAILAGPQSGIVLPITALELDEKPDHPTVTTFAKLKKGEKAERLEKLFGDAEYRKAHSLTEAQAKRIDTWLPDEMG